MNPGRTKIARLMCELWFCMNVAWMFVWSHRVSSHFYLPLAMELERWWTRTISPMPEPRNVLGQIVSSVLLGLAGLALMRMLGRFSIYVGLLRTVPGVVALAGFPLFALNFRDVFSGPIHFHRFSDLELWCIYLEILLTLVCGTIQFFGKWRIAAPVSIFLLLVHFAFWAWLTDSFITWPWVVSFRGNSGLLSLIAWIFFACGFPLLGFLSALSWGIYAARTRSAERPLARHDPVRV